ncbi:MAG: beta-lactamase family protein [Alphaproteobacteria bacterium]|nr:beta-lactamase family protein [Alphaproteobacteria bacterium]MBU1516809.1 beta-lactamase family protein [Alphaproteobacteria bacterium]MBU2092503.1 beta-lactamase family protein [Alphaproteobacteria bacterium]MBU2152366.1 beta-lactamase family protein [Alphaproteobacteria bacterium]MBU2305577.1 beta-lactamase family protein [Alphaproteobacteria bacterium]
MDGAQAPAGFNRDMLAGIGPALKGLVDQGALAGVVTLIWRKGEVVQVNTVGQRDIATGLPMERDTLFRIASMTKPVTTLAALMLVEEGKLKLSDPVTKWLPEFKDMTVLKDATGPLDAVVPAARDITVEDLMTHRSGLAYGFTSMGPIAHAHEEKLGSALANPHTPDEWMTRLGALPLSYQPGERFHYSHATDVLGFLVARVEGKPIGQVLKERIFTPLGMNDTGFWTPHEKRDRLAKLYQALPEGGLKDASWSDPETPGPFEGGGGGLISTADDYLKFARLMLGRGEVDGVRLAKAETIDQMTSNLLTDEQRGHAFLGMPFWLSQGFGLGTSMIMDAEKHQWMGAGGDGAFGWPGAFGTWWQADPANDMILIYLIQDSMPLGPEAVTAMQGQRPTGRIGCPMFQKMVYAALG